MSRFQRLGHGGESPDVHKQHSQLCKLSAQLQRLGSLPQYLIHNLRCCITFEGGRHPLFLQDSLSIMDHHRRPEKKGQSQGNPKNTQDHSFLIGSLGNDYICERACQPHCPSPCQPAALKPRAGCRQHQEQNRQLDASAWFLLIITLQKRMYGIGLYLHAVHGVSPVCGGNILVSQPCGIRPYEHNPICKIFRRNILFQKIHYRNELTVILRQPGIIQIPEAPGIHRRKTGLPASFLLYILPCYGQGKGWKYAPVRQPKLQQLVAQDAVLIIHCIDMSLGGHVPQGFVRFIKGLHGKIIQIKGAVRRCNQRGTKGSRCCGDHIFPGPRSLCQK